MKKESKFMRTKRDIIRAFEDDEKNEQSILGNLVGGFVSILIGGVILKEVRKELLK